MTNRDLFSAPAALALLGFSTATTARAIDVSVGDLEAEFLLGNQLEEDEAERLRDFLGLHGVVMVSTPFFYGALYLTSLVHLRTWAGWAEDCPNHRGEGLAYAVFSRAWRFWLRVTGRGRRILRPANDVRPMDDGAAE
ncbi:MAG: hypothetical protein Q7S93_04850 [Phenylobacterium sp.]|uniref:hypothetical protein n=1 Tax=Phenylobacterium sp. TaxID=1871053 RepID=UPI00271C1A65|nr:hypothetical protein [Phenylobacterium sp.]MDO8409370.1 hypothetical protein [Phenylobacterium sp.]